MIDRKSLMFLVLVLFFFSFVSTTIYGVDSLGNVGNMGSHNNDNIVMATSNGTGIVVNNISHSVTDSDTARAEVNVSAEIGSNTTVDSFKLNVKNYEGTVVLNGTMQTDDGIHYRRSFPVYSYGVYEYYLYVKSGNNTYKSSVRTFDVREDTGGDESGVPNFDIFIEPVREGSIENVISSNNTIHYSGSEMILILMFDKPASVSGLRVSDSRDVRYDGYYTGNLSYHYRMNFDSNGNYTVFVRFEDNMESIIHFKVDGAGTVVVDEEKHNLYEDYYQLGQDNLAQIEEIMGTEYSDDYDGVKGAYKDVIDDSRAVRTGPETFGERFFTSTLVLFLNPYMFLVIVVIVTGISLNMRTTASEVKSLGKEESADVDTIKLGLIKNIEKSRRNVANQPIEKIATARNVPRVIYKQIKDDIPTLNKLMYVLGETHIDDGVFEGELRELMVDWIRETVYLMERSDISNIRDIDPVVAFPEAVRKLVDFVAYELDYIVYEDYVKHFDFVKEEMREEMEERFDEAFDEDISGEGVDVDLDDLDKYGGL